MVQLSLLRPDQLPYLNIPLLHCRVRRAGYKTSAYTSAKRLRPESKSPEGPPRSGLRSSDSPACKLRGRRGSGLGISNFPAAVEENLTYCTAGSAWECRLGIPKLPVPKAENLANFTAGSATQCKSNPVSGRNLPKTGIFQKSAGDYRLFRYRNAPNGSLETCRQFAKARHWRAFVQVSGALSLSVGLPGWGGRIRTSVSQTHNLLKIKAITTPQLPL